MIGPELSVIIPTYNRAGHLPATVNSVLDGARVDVEVIVVDDGSTDETSEVVRGLGGPVRYIRRENAGPAAARNTGFAESRGRYVAFLDSDDLWMPGAPSRLVGLLDRHDRLAMAFGDASMGTPGGSRTSVVATFGGNAFAALPGEDLEPGVRRLERRPFFRLLARRNAVFLGSLILRREVVEHSGGFDPDLFGSEDWEFVMRLAIRHEYAYCNLPVAFYLQHAGGISRDVDRMEREFAKALRRVSKEGALDASDRRWAHRQLARQEFGYAYRAYDRGDLPIARKHFALCLGARPGVKSLGFWMASHLPQALLLAARKPKRDIWG